ncbi:MAG: NAD(P)/FAD-dependent oxidoreductase [Chloroflexota bacterium]|nr:NAD(P)/FAD-dependent oxidoreductase [Chloroflexota bacterium]
MDQYDVVIVGGGPAGLSAALVLGRARRNMLLLDGNEPRNGPSHASHSFFTRDGEHPAALRRIGRDQLAPYTTVHIEDRVAVSAEGDDGAFRVRFAEGSEIGIRKVILATGVRDILPEIEGFRRLWGGSAFACPYCDGWEVRDQPWAVLAEPSQALPYAALLSTWTDDLVLLTNGVEEIDPETTSRLDHLGVPVRTEPIARLEGEDRQLRRVIFQSGDALERTVLLHRPRQQPRTDTAIQLGCELIVDGMIPGLIRVDQLQQTTVPGVFAAGDVATPMQQIAFAVSSGSTAASMANHQLAQERLASR